MKSSDLMEDRAWLDAYRAGRPDALEAVYARYAARVVALLRGGFSFSSQGATFRFAGYRSALELQEAVQEVFARAFSPAARQGYSGLRPFEPYLLGIARNLVIDDFRRRRRELALFTPEGQDDALDRIDPAHLEHAPISAWTQQRRSPEQALLQRELEALVASFVASLEGEHRTLTDLLFIQRRPQREVADLMGVDRNHVRKLAREVRLKLLRALKSAGRISTLDGSDLVAALLAFL